MPHNVDELNNLPPIYSAEIIENLKLLKDNQEYKEALRLEYETAKKISHELRKRIEELLKLTKGL